MDKFPSNPSIFLDSGNGWLADPDQTDKYLLFDSPVATLSFQDGVTTVIKEGNKTSTKRDPFYVLEGYLAQGYVAAGYIGYEYAKYTDSGFIPKHKKDGGKLPDILLNIYKTDDRKVGDIAQLKYDLTCLNHCKCSSNRPLDTKIISNMDKGSYKDIVSQVKSYIESGDIYQANLSQRYIAQFDQSPLYYFLKLYEAQPVPFGSYMDFGNFQVISGSMELFLRKTGKKLQTKPIKGTKRRGKTEELDTVKRAELVSSEKERAENLMIVDLMRNDLARICEKGSVRVQSLFNIESYSTLHQMVSEVQGNINEHKGLGEILKSVFPPGSVTGAPKKRALEIIDLLEPHLRGPYCGALGIFYPDGDFVLSVGIRLVVAEAGNFTFWVGGGIVWDSDPEKEYEETLLKSYAIQKALGILE